MRQKIGILCVMCFCVLLVFCGEVYSQIWYVDAAKPAGGDGTSWPTAFNTIQSAIDAASSSWTECQPPTDQIWVKQGTYTLAAELTLGKTVTLYGGFPSFYISPTLAQRKPSVYTTTINGNNVTRCMTITSYSIIDGFTFTGGYSSTGFGGALNITSVGSVDCSLDPKMMLTISNCNFTENFAYAGGAVYASYCSAKFENCSFSLNSADSGGGAVYHTNCYDSEYSGIYFDRCTFCQNVNNGYSIYGGGAVLGESSYDEISNCLFYQNYSAYGGAITYSNCYSVIKNCTIADNEAGSGGAIYNRYAAPTLTNCILWNEESADEIHEGGDTSIVTYSDVRGGFTGMGNINVDPLFVSSSDYHLMPNSLCIDTGTNTGAPTIDIEDNSRPVDGNNDGSAITDMGAYEVAYADLVVQSVSLNPAVPQVGQPVTITVVVRNQGVADTDTFRVDWYANRSLSPTAGEYGEVYQVFSSLSSGATATMTRTYTYSSVGSFSMYAQVDSMANVEESNEDNNVYGPGFVRVIDGTLLDFNIQPESYNISTWFGGDDGSTQCNTGVGQSMITTRQTHATAAGFRFTQRFDYANNPESIGHAVTLYLDIRNSTGAILKTVSKFVSAKFLGGWVNFDLGTDFWMEADTTYIFTCYLYQGEYNELKSDACGQTIHPWPTLTGYHAVVKSVPADMETWSNWSTRTYDFNFHLAGQYVEPYPGDITGDGHVNLTDLKQFAENWLFTDCVMPGWCENCDFNWSGSVQFEDFSILSSFWDKTYFDYDDLDRAAIVLLESEMSSDRISDSELNPGTYFVYRTNDSRYGKFIVEDLNAITHALTIGWTAYNTDGSVFKTGSGLLIHINYHCDLDQGIETTVGGDFYWEQEWLARRYLSPENTAIFKLVYQEP